VASDPAPDWQPPSGRSIARSIALAAVVAAILLVTIVLPAEYGIDPTGVGSALGLDALRSAPTRTIEVRDPLAGNEAIREIEIPDAGQPVPLPNPDIHQPQEGPPETRTLTVTIPPEEETEIKTVLRPNKVIVYSWTVKEGNVYCDFHGHDPVAGNDFWVRYQEDQEANSAHGSLVAPFAGEHGWYWLNFNDFPVTITLTVTGYFDDVIDYGIF
jgi:hypothetical protein